MKDHTSVRRRDFLAGGAALGAGLALEALPRRARAAPAPLDPASPAAAALGYAHDGAATARPSADQTCEKCLQFTPVGGGEWGRCNVFPDHVVNSRGWCAVFAPRG